MNYCIPLIAISMLFMSIPCCSSNLEEKVTIINVVEQQEPISEVEEKITITNVVEEQEPISEIEEKTIITQIEEEQTVILETPKLHVEPSASPKIEEALQQIVDESIKAGLSADEIEAILNSEDIQELFEGVEFGQETPYEEPYAVTLYFQECLSKLLDTFPFLIDWYLNMREWYEARQAPQESDGQQTGHESSEL